MSNTTKREVGGNSLTLWLGRLNGRIAKFFQNRSEKLIKKGSTTIITNPTCRFINHCTMIFNFTIDGNEKYQLIHQGKFVEKYKSWRKLVEEQEVKLNEWEISMEEWENSDINSRGAAPQKPELIKYPLTIDEMFQTILSMDKSWYKKDIL